MAIVVVSEKGQLVLPAEIRKRHHIGKGTLVAIDDKDGRIVLRPLHDGPAKGARGLFKEGKSALKVLIEDRKFEACRSVRSSPATRNSSGSEMP